jgi:hypothetical protein
MHYIDKFIIPNRLYIFRAKFSPIIGSTWLYLKYLLVFTQDAGVPNGTPAGSILGEHYQML